MIKTRITLNLLVEEQPDGTFTLTDEATKKQYYVKDGEWAKLSIRQHQQGLCDTLSVLGDFDAWGRP
jgi:hypothetical protein